MILPGIQRPVSEEKQNRLHHPSLNTRNDTRNGDGATVYTALNRVLYTLIHTSQDKHMICVTPEFVEHPGQPHDLRHPALGKHTGPRRTLQHPAFRKHTSQTRDLRHPAFTEHTRQTHNLRHPRICKASR